MKLTNNKDQRHGSQRCHLKKKITHLQNKNFGISWRPDTDCPCPDFHQYTVVVQDTICSTVYLAKNVFSIILHNKLGNKATLLLTQVRNDVRTELTFQTLTREHFTLHKKWSFPLRVLSVNVAKSAVSCGLGYIYWRNP